MIRIEFRAIGLILAALSNSPGQWLQIEDFESGFTVGATVDGVEGWNASAPARAIAANNPGNGDRGTVCQLIAQSSSRCDLSYPLGVGEIGSDATGTLFFEIYLPASGSSNLSIGFSEDNDPLPSDFSSFGPQHRYTGNSIAPRNGGSFIDTGFDASLGEWSQVWMVVDNAANEVDIYLERPNGGSGQTLVASGYKFRNSSLTALKSFFAIQVNGRDHYIDNIFVDSNGSNLNNPLLPEPTPSPVDDLIEVGVSGALGFDPFSNDEGSIDKSSLEIVTAPNGGSATFDASSERIVYKHTGTNSGTDVFRYRVSNLDQSATAEADVNVSVSGALRLENTTLNVPLDAPAPVIGSLTIQEGLGGLRFNSAVAMTSIPETPEALLVASINGTIWYVPDTTVASPTKHPVLNVASLSNFTRGRSIYSIECFPDFATTGHVVVNYQGDASRIPTPSAGQTIHDVVPNLDRDGSPDATITCDLRVSRFTLSAAHISDAVANGMDTAENLAALDTELPYINLAEQHLFHSINDCKFGPDGFLYVSFGDEGDQGDPFRNGQRLTKDYYSSLLRIDVDPASTNPKPNPYYAIAAGNLNGSGQYVPFTNAATQNPNFRVPADNPFIHSSLGGSWNGDFNGNDLSGQLPAVRTEVWALGLRNPFKFHLDVEDGTGETEAWIGDVGKSSREEFTILKKGENAGWSYFEGDIPTPGLSYNPDQPAGSTPHKAPLFTYPFTNGNNSAIGGVFYRESELGVLTNRYVCGDHGSGRIWSVARNGDVSELPNSGIGGNTLVDFHLDPVTKDIFVLEHNSSGRVMRITEQAGEVVEDYPPTLSSTGVFADLIDLSPNPGVLPYVPNLTFWSDGAEKKRWFVLPNMTDTISYSKNGNWDFPEGTTWIKHFDYDLDQQNPGTNVRRLETRLLVRNAGGAYGVSYRWNAAGTEADLVALTGEEFPINFTNALGGAESFNWQIPSRSNCMTCHTPAAGHALSFNTRQLNKNFLISGQSGNQLSLLSSGGYLSGFDGILAGLERHYRPDEIAENLESRVRSYLAVNCSYCHQPDGGAPSSWDGRAEMSIEATNLLYGDPISEGTPDLTDHIIRPGDRANSAIWNKINARAAINGTFNGYTQMPPLASNRIDPEGVALIGEWIDNYANVPPSHVGISSSNISEGSVIGASVGSANANDPDVRNSTADQSQVTYEITGGNQNDFFQIDASTGEITVTGWLDFEDLSSHLLQVKASDNFAPNPQSVTTAVAINVSDIANEDANENGLPDSWESFYSLVNATKGGDADQDGVLDFFELLSGGSPIDVGTPEKQTVAILPASDLTEALFSWVHLNGFELGEEYLLQGSGALNGWNELTEGVHYQIVSDMVERPGYRRMSIRLLDSAPDRFFLRLSSP